MANPTCGMGAFYTHFYDARYEYPTYLLGSFSSFFIQGASVAKFSLFLY